jgi:modulator of FtsH protease HflC
LKGTHTRIVLSPTSEYFRYFNSPSNAGVAERGKPPSSGQPDSNTAAAAPPVR